MASVRDHHGPRDDRERKQGEKAVYERQLKRCGAGWGWGRDGQDELNYVLVGVIGYKGCTID